MLKNIVYQWLIHTQMKQIRILIGLLFTLNALVINAQNTEKKTFPFNLFTTDSIVKVYINLAENDLQFLNADPARKDYVVAQVKWGNQIFDSVAMRYKGSVGTLQSCIDSNKNRVCEKFSIKLDFNQYIKGQKLHGIKKINLNSMVRDPSKMREKLTYDLFRNEGIASPRSTWVNVFVNNKSWGLYAVVEQIDKTFIEHHFPGNDTGFIFKETWPNNFDTAIYNSHQKNKTDNLQGQRFVDFYTALQSNPKMGSLDTFLNFNVFTKFLAINNAVNNWDGITTFFSGPWGGGEPHNFYWYLYNNKLTPIIWDVDVTLFPKSFFKELPPWFQEPEDCSPKIYPGYAYILPALCDDLFGYTKMFYFNDFKNHFNRINKKYFLNSNLIAEVNRWQKLLEPEMKNEPSFQAWLIEVEKLKSAIVYLGIKNQNIFEQSSIYEGFEFYENQIFEHIPKEKLEALCHANVNAQSAIKVEKRNNEILVKTALNKNSNDNAWATLKIPFQQPQDFSKYQHLNLTAAATEKNPTIKYWQIALWSENYPNPEISEYYGTTFQITEKEQTLKLNLLDFEIFSWANINTKVPLEKILQSVSGIIIQPIITPEVSNSLKQGAVVSEISIKNLSLESK